MAVNLIDGCLTSGNQTCMSYYISEKCNVPDGIRSRALSHGKPALYQLKEISISLEGGYEPYTDPLTLDWRRVPFTCEDIITDGIIAQINDHYLHFIFFIYNKTFMIDFLQNMSCHIFYVNCNIH